MTTCKVRVQNCMPYFYSFFSEQHVNSLLFYRRLQIQLLILPLQFVQYIAAAGLSSLDNYFGNVSYLLIIILCSWCPLYLYLEVLKQDNLYL